MGLKMANNASITPEDLIEALRETDPYIETIFMEGGCYRFHLMLKRFWPYARPVITFDEGHVGTMIDGKVYDITGISVEPFRDMTESEKRAAAQWNFADQQMLKISECPACHEPIVI